MKKSTSGFSIVEVLVSVSIMIVLGLGLVQLIVSQNKEVRGLQEKLILLDVQNTMQKVLASSAYCGCFLSGKIFDKASKTWNSFPTSMSVSYELPSCNPLGGNFFSVGNTLPLSSIKVTELTMTNINETIIGSNNYTGEISLKIDANTMVRSRKNVNVTVNFTVDPSGNMLSCNSSSTPVCRRVVAQGPGPYYISNPRCNPDEYAMTGGGFCEQPAAGLCAPTTRRGFIHQNTMDPDGKGWTVDCFGTAPDIVDVCSEGYVICCK